MFRHNLSFKIKDTKQAFEWQQHTLDTFFSVLDWPQIMKVCSPKIRGQRMANSSLSNSPGH